MRTYRTDLAKLIVVTGVLSVSFCLASFNVFAATSVPTAAAATATTSTTALKNTTPNPTNIENSTVTATPNKPENPAQYCPAASELQKDGMWWSARAGVWKSYSQSFAKSINSFIGAQWLGINVGKIICLYSGQDSFDFPIALQTVKTYLIISPDGANWHQLKSGYKACKSNNIYDCPFFLKPPEDVTDIYEQIKYKGTPGADTNASNESFMYR